MSVEKQLSTADACVKSKLPCLSKTGPSGAIIVHVKKLNRTLISRRGTNIGLPVEDPCKSYFKKSSMLRSSKTSATTVKMLMSPKSSISAYSGSIGR